MIFGLTKLEIYRNFSTVIMIKMFTIRQDMHGYPQMFDTMCTFGNKKI